MIKVLAIIISTIIVLTGCLGFGFGDEIAVDSDKALYFLGVALVIAYTVGYQLIFKDWGLKKSFIGFHVVPIALALAFHFIN